MTDGHTPDLIERIERATGPDRELDCLIWGSIEGRSLEWQGRLLVEKTEGPIGWIDPGEHQRNFGCNRADQGANGIRAYTRSLDAAMRLIPDKAMCDGGWRVEYHHDLKKRCHATVWLHEHAEVGDGWFTAWGVTPAIAICAASLKARAIP